MKIQIYTGVLSRKAGGLFYAVSNLAKTVKKNGCKTTITGFLDEYSQKDLNIYSDVPLNVYKTSWPFRNFGFSSDILRIMCDLSPDIIHQQGIWSFLSWYTLRYKNKYKETKIIITPHGMLDPWIVKRSPIKKWIVRKWFEDKNLKKADCIHALCRSEYNSIRQYGLKNPVAIIPNGTNIPNWKRDYGNFKSKKVKTILFLSRLHPKKGVLELIEAYASICKKNSNLAEKWSLKIGGWGDDVYISEIKNLIKRYNLHDNIELMGAVYGQEKDNLLKSVDAFILPTYSEGLPMAVLEAWAYGLPVITTDGSNLPEGFETGAAFRIENDVQKLTGGLIEFLSKSDEDIFLYGQKGFELAVSSFSWDSVGKKCYELYNWILGKGEKPEFVYL